MSDAENLYASPTAEPVLVKVGMGRRIGSALAVLGAGYWGLIAILCTIGLAYIPTFRDYNSGDWVGVAGFVLGWPCAAALIWSARKLRWRETGRTEWLVSVACITLAVVEHVLDVLDYI